LKSIVSRLNAIVFYSKAIRMLAALAKGAKNNAMASMAPSKEKWAATPSPLW
jgi:hypothetical protein